MRNDIQWILVVVVVMNCAEELMVIVDGSDSSCRQRWRQGARVTQAKARQGREGKGKGKRVRVRGQGQTKARGQGLGWTCQTTMAARAGATRREQRGIAALAAAARMGVARQQWRQQGRQQGPGQEQRSSNNSSKIGGKAVTTAVRTITRKDASRQGQCGNNNGILRQQRWWVNSDGGGKSKGSAATTAGHHGNGDGSDKGDSKGNSGKNGDRGRNNGGGISHLSLIFFCRAQDTVTRFVFLLNT